MRREPGVDNRDALEDDCESERDPPQYKEDSDGPCRNSKELRMNAENAMIQQEHTSFDQWKYLDPQYAADEIRLGTCEQAGLFKGWAESQPTCSPLCRIHKKCSTELCVRR